MATKRGQATGPAPRIDLEAAQVAVGGPIETWAHQCHSVSLAFVRAGLVEGRVVRGSCVGVGGQHSWIVPLDWFEGMWIRKDHWIIDPTLWSYDDDVEGILYTSYDKGRHHPHGAGSIWEYGRPGGVASAPVELTPKSPLSRRAEEFLRIAGAPFDRTGWAILFHSPVEGWPASEILAAADDTEALSALVPIDLLGNYTDRNPGGVYLP